MGGGGVRVGGVGQDVDGVIGGGEDGAGVGPGAEEGVGGEAWEGVHCKIIFRNLTKTHRLILEREWFVTGS